MFSEEIKRRKTLNTAEMNRHPITTWQELQRNYSELY